MSITRSLKDIYATLCPNPETSYAQGPDTYLLQLRDTDFPLRLRQYMKVGVARSPSLAESLRGQHWGGSDVSSSYLNDKQSRKYSL